MTANVVVYARTKRHRLTEAPRSGRPRGVARTSDPGEDAGDAGPLAADGFACVSGVTAWDTRSIACRHFRRRRYFVVLASKPHAFASAEADHRGSFPPLEAGLPRAYVQLSVGKAFGGTCPSRQARALPTRDREISASAKQWPVA